MGGVIAKEFAGKRIAILHDKSAYGAGLAQEIQKAINAAGQKEVLFTAYTPGEKDYSALVTSLKTQNVEVVVIGGYHTEAGLITRQLRAAGSTAQIFGGDALVTNEFWSITGPAGEGVLMSFGPDPRKKPEAAAAVASLRKSKYEPEGYTLYAYAAAQVLAGGVKAAGKAEAVAAADALHKETVPTVLGLLAFDAKGDIKAPAYVIYKWSNGGYAER